MSSATQIQPWNVHRLPRADGKTFLVTGGNADIGYFVAEQLSSTGATVGTVGRCRGRQDVNCSVTSRSSHFPVRASGTTTCRALMPHNARIQKTSLINEVVLRPFARTDREKS
jgi:NAD(P)-dependent dehydrogenase (short-subunit alcohol dehydrogenase family)